MSFPRYPKYKDSGVEWLGEVPEHWEVSKLRRLFEIQKRIAGVLGYDVFSITQNGIRVKDIESNEGQQAMDYSKYQLVHAGDFAMNPMDLITGGADIAKYTGVTSPDYRVCTLKQASEHSDRFLLYLFQNAYRRRLFYPFGQGSSQLGRWRLPRQQFNSFSFPLPPKSEQHAIAAFLDRETAKIDALIAEQQRLIELLQEKRQAVISHAVTKGLNPDAPMKDSGIEWLGEVPAHWNIMPVWLLFELGRGRVISHNEIADNPGPYPVYSSQTQNDGAMGQIGTFDYDGDYLTWTTDGAHAGTVFQRRGRFNCTNVCGTLKARSNMVSLDYACRAIQSATGYFVRHDINPKLMNNVMSGIRIPVPPDEEQAGIVSRVAELVETAERLSAEMGKAIFLLQERRSALISAAVTGQIDVRSLAPKEAA
jgi:type I restriction enzyme S subunit